MAAEIDHHLMEEKAAGAGPSHRNGSTRRRWLTNDHHTEVTISPACEAGFDPVLIGMY